MPRQPRTKTSERAPQRSRKSAAPTPHNTAETGDHERALWKGTISLGLIQIPVSLRTAEQAHELSFHQLDKNDNSPIGYERVNKTTGKSVPWADIVKGYEVEKGRYVIVTDEDFEKANVAATQTIEIQDFVDENAISPVYFDRPYYILADKIGEKAYAVLRDVLQKKNLVGVATVVIRTRQHLAVVMSKDGLLVLELLRFAHELRPVPRALDAGVKATSKEIALAEQLIDGMTAEWAPDKYKDAYRNDLLDAIRHKAKTGTLEPRHLPAHGPTPVNDLLALLKKSVGDAAAKPKSRRRAA